MYLLSLNLGIKVERIKWDRGMIINGVCFFICVCV